MKLYSTFVICFIILKVCLSKNINLNDEGKKKQSDIINENEEGKNNKSNNNKKVQHNKMNRKGNNSVSKKTDEHKNDGDGKNKKMDERKNDVDGKNKKMDEHKNDVDGEHKNDVDGEKNNILEYNNIDEHNEFPESLENDNFYDKLFDDVELRDIIHNEKFFENVKNVNNNDVDNFLLVDKEMERRKEEEKKKSRKLEEDEDEEEDNDEKWKEENKNNNKIENNNNKNNNNKNNNNKNNNNKIENNNNKNNNSSSNIFNKNYDIYDNGDIYNDDNLVDITQEENTNALNINDEINEGGKHDKEAFLIFEKKLNEFEDRNDSIDGDNKMEDLINNHFHDSGDNGSYENIQVKKELYNKNEKIIKGRDNNLNDGDIPMNKNNTSNKFNNNNNNMNNEMKYKTFKEEYEEQILSKPESIKYFFEVITEILIVIRLGLIYRYTNFLIPFKNFLISRTLENVEMVCVTFLSIHKFGREKYPDIYGFFLIILILYILKYVFKKMIYKLYYNKYGMGKKYSLKNQESENMYMENLLKRILYNVEKKKVLSNYESILQDILENTDNLLVNSNIINKENKNIYTDMISNINNIGVFTYISTQALKKINHKSDLIINELTTNGFIDEDTSNKMDKLKKFSSINEYPYVDIKKFKDNLVNEYDEHFILNDKMRYSGFHSMENDKSPPNNKYNMDSYNMDSYNMDSYNMDINNMDINNMDINNMDINNMDINNMDINNMDINNMDNNNMDINKIDNNNMDINKIDNNNMDINKIDNNNMGVHLNMNNNYLSNKYKHDSAYDENKVQDLLQKSKKQDYGHVKNALKDGNQMIYNNMDANKKDDNYFNKMMRDSDLSNYNGRKSIYFNGSLEDDLKNNDYDNNKNFDYANNSTYIVEGKEIQQVDKNKTNDMDEKKKDESFIHYDKKKKIINNLNPFSPLNDYNNISNNKKNTINEEQNNNINDSDVITNIVNSYINKPPSNINRFSQSSIYNTHNKVTNPLLNEQRNVTKEGTQRKNTEEASVNNKVEENYLRNNVTNHDMEESVENKLDEDKLKMSTHMVNNIFEGTKEYIKTNEEMNNISKAGDPFFHNQEGSFSYAPPPYQGVENSNNKNQKYLTQRKERQQIVATKSPFN
ncbi:secreted ookinete protein, putative [Plasmodium reichenowi]|uniref:Secreted ookinete protein, putative n=1 Tax=Plasmodium reichenowi TaxID=5854 RepID=A0A151LW67_PLARE|nr:secreted ookinete protein, putative [Plasmodium reichenowi]KYO03417.1 secreted ookinete protein, putative [Plasmodium reichenowi]